MEFEKLLRQATDSVCLNPKLDLFEELGGMMNKRPTSAKELIPIVKKRLRNKNPRTQILTLEFVEYLTCVSWQQVHHVLHENTFLQVINSLLNQSPAEEIKEKCLYLIKFWADFFRHDRDIFPNFGKMYERAKSAGIQFPQQNQSQYSQMRRMPEPSAIFGRSRPNKYGNHYGQSQGGFSQGRQAAGPGGMSPAFQKVKNDLEVLVENIDKADGFLQRGNKGPEAQNLFSRLRSMEGKMRSLVSKLEGTGNNYMIGLAENVTRKLNSFLDRLDNRSGSGSGFGQGGDSFANFGFDEPAKQSNFGSSGNGFDDFANAGMNSNGSFGNQGGSQSSGGGSFWGQGQQQPANNTSNQPTNENDDLLGDFSTPTPQPQQQQKQDQGDNLLDFDSPQAPQGQQQAQIDMDFTQQAPQTPVQPQQGGFIQPKMNQFGMMQAPQMMNMNPQQMLMMQQMQQQQMLMMMQQQKMAAMQQRPNSQNHNPFGGNAAAKNISYEAPQYHQNNNNQKSEKDPFGNLNQFMQ